ncbi:DUF4340 domain-containing protein [Natronospira bacteriovora]|uniref:DUF4340 domain-containing protein n=1 Tax=Natronospira bacteriovora TaxID=3069753 RepID=A0ABU0W9B0_9GAMM|nr:DUF4340 domain-containing protein [Natronospira sp. AB-CW4]MDQ2070493.1 DUF4340 domain-containing protein [Natronospira sp. AB-CW4]
MNIFLLGGLAVIGLLFWLAMDEEAGDEPLLDIPVGEIREVSARDDGGLLWRLVPTETGWRLTGEMAAPAHPERVRQMLVLLRAPVHGRYSVDDLDPARVGLDQPVLRIEVNGQALTVGDSEPVQRRRYVQRGDEILLVDELVYLQLARSGIVLVDNRLLPGGGPVEAIEFPGQTLARGEAGRWTLTPGGEAVAQLDEDDLARLARNWETAQSREAMGWMGETVDVPLIRVHQRDGRTRVFHVVEDSAAAVTLASPETGLRYRFPAGQRPALLLPDDDA